MLARLLLVLALTGAGPALGGCAAFQAIAQRQAIQEARFHFKGATLAAVTLAGADVALALELENPTRTPIVLDRVDYVLSLNGARLLSGFSDARLTVPPGQVRPLTLQSTLRLADVGSRALELLRDRKAALRLTGTGHFDTPVGTLDYPLDLFQL